MLGNSKFWLAAAAVSCGLVLGGCAEDEPGGSGEDRAGSAETSPTDDATANGATTDGATTGATATETVTETETATATGAPSPSLPPRPKGDDCVEVQGQGRGSSHYVVYDAGHADVRRDGQRLRVRQVTPEPGWTKQLTERGDGDDVEIVFLPKEGRNGLELNVELDDGKLQAEICAEARDDRDDRDDRDRDDRDRDDRD